MNFGFETQPMPPPNGLEKFKFEIAVRNSATLMDHHGPLRVDISLRNLQFCN